VKFLEYRNKIKTGPGKIEEDIKQARKHRLEKYKLIFSPSPNFIEDPDLAKPNERRMKST
jgi:hypothetical protein